MIPPILGVQVHSEDESKSQNRNSGFNRRERNSPRPVVVWRCLKGRIAMTSADENKALVRRFYEEIDKGNIGILDELVAEDYLDHNPPPFPSTVSGRERLKREFKLFLEATPGYHHIEDQIAEGDKVVTRLTSYGKHEGDLPGAPRTGNDMKMTSITIHRIADGKLVEKWSEKDMISLLQQIGVMPSMHAKR